MADRYLAGCRRVRHLDTAAPSAWGNVVTPEMYHRHRQSLQEAMGRALDVAQEADRAWSELTGRSYGLLERYRCDDARIVVVALGSMCGTAREAIDALRAEGIAAGLLKLRLFRPLPQEALRVALAGVPDVLVLDRNHSPGLGGILHHELRGALYGLPNPPRVHGVLAGVGGVDVQPRHIRALVTSALLHAPQPQSTWS
jgi:pyruvate/2-oxoacid:ferredoxin oxidoreductase alpha subunit